MKNMFTFSFHTGTFELLMYAFPFAKVQLPVKELPPDSIIFIHEYSKKQNVHSKRKLMFKLKSQKKTFNLRKFKVQSNCVLKRIK